MNCPNLEKHPIVTSRSGQRLCARHHNPLVTVHGYTTREYGEPAKADEAHSVTLYHSYWEQLLLEICNPNFIPRINLCTEANSTHTGQW